MMTAIRPQPLINPIYKTATARHPHFFLIGTAAQAALLPVTQHDFLLKFYSSKRLVHIARHFDGIFSHAVHDISRAAHNYFGLVRKGAPVHVSWCAHSGGGWTDGSTLLLLRCCSPHRRMQKTRSLQRQTVYLGSVVKQLNQNEPKQTSNTD